MVPAAGGALVFGGVRRTVHRPSIAAGALLGLGVVVLANSRPYEGLLACVPAALVMMRWLAWDRRVPAGSKLARFVVPIAAVLGLGCAWTAVHNRAVTGSALQLPYALHQRQYFHQGVFLFSGTRPPERPPHPQIDVLTRSWTYTPLRGTSLIREVAANVLTRLPRTMLASFGTPPSAGRTFLGASIWIPALLLAGAWPSRRLLLAAGGLLAAELALWRWEIAYPAMIGFAILAVFIAILRATRAWDRWMRYIVATVGLVVAGNALVWWWFPHYVAPVVPLVIAAAAIGAHRLARVSPHFDPQRLAVNTLLLLVLHATALTAAIGLTPRGERRDTQPTYVDIRRTLTNQGGKHLVFVHYGADYPSFRGDWVYNDPDIASSIVVFAHDLGPERNRALKTAYPDRRPWSLEVAGSAVLLTPGSPVATADR
jgi:hypothetical protein